MHCSDLRTLADSSQIGCNVELNSLFICGQRSVVEVVWTGSQKRNIYRVGHKGKVYTRTSPETL